MAHSRATDQTVSASKAVQPQVMSVAVSDPVGDLRASTRVHQQVIVPAAVQQRNITIQLLNTPDPSGEPSWIIFGTVANGTSRTVNWTTGPQVAGTELFAMSQMSFYFSTNPYNTYADFKANTPQWPGAAFNMANVICSFWQDEAMSDGVNVSSRQSLYNFSGGPIYVMATLRLRIIANTTNVSTS